ncbi:MAG TPA: bile acid:sodium symporter family protein [Phaeodactylibacter sp.]|nr:bile acid:sodium symporter family protein [Phaeodactylibacter sp.]
MHEIDQVRIDFHEGDLLALNFLLAFIMFGVALDLHLQDFRNILKAPGAALVGMASEYLLLPLLSLALVFVFRPPVSLGLGMMLIATCPGGNVSNFMVHLARGNTALSVSLTSVSTLAAVLITPLSFAFWSGFVPGSEEVFREVSVNPWKMVKSITILILIPVGLGMWFQGRFPDLTRRIKRGISRLSMLLFLGFIFIALYKNLGKMAEHLHWVFWIVAIHNGLSLLTGYTFARLFRLSEADARAIAIETGIQNTGLGLVLVFNFFSGLGGMAMILAWWGVWHLLSGFVLAWGWSRVGFSPR